MCEHMDYARKLSENIGRLRRSQSLTQEQLAAKLGVTYQAVSKWENGTSCPDLMLLPMLADIFGVTVDGLLGIEREEAAPASETNIQEITLPAPDSELHIEIDSKNIPPVPPVIVPPCPVPIPRSAEPDGDLPWEDDGVLRVVVYQGHKLLDTITDPISKVVFELHAEDCDLVKVDSSLSVICGDVTGDVTAGYSVECGDVTGDVTAGSTAACGDVEGDVTAGKDLSCKDVEGDVTAGGSLVCCDINGNAEVGKGVTCSDIGGYVSCQTILLCGNIGGSVYYQKAPDKK